MTKTMERMAASRALRVAMSLVLLLSMCVALPKAALAADTVDVSVGDKVWYAGYNTCYMQADGQAAYCAEPNAATPEPGAYSKGDAAGADLTAVMWFSYGAPGFDETMFPDSWYDGSGWDDDKYLVASHILLAYAYQGSGATYGTSADFAEWAESELFGGTWNSMMERAGEVSTGFSAFTIDTGSSTQTLVSFTWEKGGLKLVKADSEAGAAAQGDALLAGAEFSIVNASGKAALVGGDSYADGQTVKVIKTEWDPEAGAYVAATGDDALPCGTYRVVETKAPEGYELADWSRTVEIDSDGQVVDLSGDACSDDVVRGGVQVIKRDRELGASEAIGGADHASEVGPNLSGIEFTVTNQSASKVLVNGMWYEPGQAVATIVTAWNEEAHAYTAQTASDALPYGTYSVQETATNGSYLLSDGEPRTFQVREDGVVVNATSDGEALAFDDQVARNDLKLSKKADSTSESLQVPFLITNVTTGEAHVLVTDRNGQASTAAGWNKHSANTNGNDALASADGVIATADMDASAGIWFALGEDGSQAAVNDDLAALPYGEYTLEELRCEANEGMELVTKSFWVERDSGAAEAVWMTIDDQEGPSVHTEATDKADGDHVAQCADEVTIVDTVYYDNLQAGQEYELTGTLMVKSTGEAMKDADGNSITATKTFTANASSGTVELGFTFDGGLLAGEDVVAFESLRHEGVEVAAHADISDEGQTIHFLSIHTTATDKADGDKVLSGDEATVNDEVAYEGLEPGAEYTLTATLMDAQTGEAVTGADGKAVTATTTFTPDAADGTQAVEIAIDSEGLDGKKLVVFEKLDCDGVQQAAHEDLADEGQTVTVDSPKTPETPETPSETVSTSYDKTGVDMLPGLLMIIVALAGSGALIAYALPKRRNDDNEPTLEDERKDE